MSRAPATSRARAGGHEPLREMPAGLADDPEQPLRGVALDPTGVTGLPAVAAITASLAAASLMWRTRSASQRDRGGFAA